MHPDVKYLICALLFLAAGAAFGQTTQNEFGTLILRPFANAPYPHKSRENGFTLNGKTFPRDPHYVDSTVGLFIPAGYKPGASADFIVHFHGHMNHVAQVFEQFDLAREMKESGLNAILVVPQGPKDATDSGDGHLELDPGGFAALMHEVAQYLTDAGVLKTPTIGRIALTAHSGGYKVTSAILDHGGLGANIKDVVLFDASYGNLDGFADWARKGHGRRLISIFTEHLASANVLLMSLLSKSHTPFRVVMEPDLTDADLRPRSVLFIHAPDMAHNDVVSKKHFFNWFLRTGALK